MNLSIKKRQLYKQNCIDYYNNNVERYIYTYAKDYSGYPGNQIRFEIIRNLVKKNAPKKILYIGCGACVPMSKLMQEFDCLIHGIDFSQNMIDRGKIILKENGFSPNLIYKGDIETLESLPDEKYDFVIAAGVFTHLPDDQIALNNIHLKLNNGGTLAIEFRNELFSLFSFNKYSYDFFFNKLISNINLPDLFKNKTEIFLKKVFNLQNDIQIIPDSTHISNGLIKKFHNPLTIRKILEDNGFTLNNNFFYHYHALPTSFENFNQKIFNNISIEYEDPTSWKGHFMASAFVAEATKKSL